MHSISLTYRDPIQARGPMRDRIEPELSRFANEGTKGGGLRDDIVTVSQDEHGFAFLVDEVADATPLSRDVDVFAVPGVRKDAIDTFSETEQEGFDSGPAIVDCDVHV